MRTIKTLSVFAVLATLLIAAPSQALLSGVNYFDFAGWDVDMVTSPGGQDFDVLGPSSFFPAGLSVNVQVDGALTTPPIYATNGFIRSGHLDANATNRFRFTFSESVSDIVVKTATVDSQENFDILGVATEMYFHDSGAVPTVTDIGTSGVTIMGTSTGQGADGASFGETTTAAQAGLPLILRHDSLSFADKWEFFMVGTRVPEPSAYSLLALSLLGMLGIRRRG